MEDKKKISTRRHVGSFWSLWTVQDKKEESKRVGHDLNKIVQKKKNSSRRDLILRRFHVQKNRVLFGSKNCTGFSAEGV